MWAFWTSDFLSFSSPFTPIFLSITSSKSVLFLDFLPSSPPLSLICPSFTNFSSLHLSPISFPHQVLHDAPPVFSCKWLFALIGCASAGCHGDMSSIRNAWNPRCVLIEPSCNIWGTFLFLFSLFVLPFSGIPGFPGSDGRDGVKGDTGEPGTQQCIENLALWAASPCCFYFLTRLTWHVFIVFSVISMLKFYSGKCVSSEYFTCSRHQSAHQFEESEAKSSERVMPAAALNRTLFFLYLKLYKQLEQTSPPLHEKTFYF